MTAIRCGPVKILGFLSSLELATFPLAAHTMNPVSEPPFQFFLLGRTAVTQATKSQIIVECKGLIDFIKR